MTNMVVPLLYRFYTYIRKNTTSLLSQTADKIMATMFISINSSDS